MKIEDGKEVAVISGKSCVLGEVSLVKKSGIVTRRDTKRRSYSFTPEASAKPIQPRDVICLLHGASKPTIIRLRRDHWAVIRIVAPIAGDSEAADTKWSERLESIRAFPDDFLLVWDWDVSQDRVPAKGYEDFESGNGLSDGKSEPQDNLDRATRLWRVGRVLECVERDEEAEKRFERALEMGMMVLTGGDGPGPSHGSRAAWGGLLVEDRGVWASLSYAAKKGYGAVVRQLLEEGAVVDVKDRDGWTPLCWAAWGGHEAIVQQLYEKGAKVDVKDRFGRTPLSRAALNGHEAVVWLLESYGARR